MEYKEWFPYITNVCLNVTDSCNLKCIYCFVNNQPHYMDLQVAKDTVDFLYNNYQEKAKLLENVNTPNITFFGGEPMLMYNEIIKPTVEYAAGAYPSLFSFNITTNGTLLSKKSIDFFSEHNIPILLSIDGAPETQNYNRPLLNGGESASLVWRNVPYLLERFPYTTFRATIHKDTVQNTYDNYLAAEDAGFKRAFFMPNSREDWTEEQKEKLKYQTSLIFTRMINQFLNNNRPKTLFTPIVDMFKMILNHDSKIILKTKEQDSLSRNVVRCGLGTTSASVGFDGKIYGCQEQTSQEDNIFYIGDIYNGIDYQRHYHLLDEYSTPSRVKCENPEMCEKCLLKGECGRKLCPSMTYEVFGSFFVNSDIACYWLQVLMDYCRAMMKICVDCKSESFKQFLKNECGFGK